MAATVLGRAVPRSDFGCECVSLWEDAGRVRPIVVNELRNGSNDMSEWGDYVYETEAQRRRRERRARRAAQRLLSRYERTLQELEAEGIAAWVAATYAALSAEIARIRELLDSDPLAARDEAFELGGDVSMFVRVARKAAEEERRRRAKRSALDQLFEETLADLVDPVERDFAYEEMRRLIGEKEALVASEEAVEDTIARVRQRIAEIRARAQARAAEWRAEQEAAITEEVTETVAEAVGAAIQEEEGEQLTENQLDALREFSAAIVRLAREEGEQKTQQRDAIRETAERLTAAPSEEDRRQVVQALYQALTGLGFVVEQPVRIQEEGEDVVVVRARRPAGQCAELKVTASGQLGYKFDNYEGMSCKGDIDQVMNLLQSVYGVKLSKHRVLWQNPDRISRTARRGQDSVGGGAHGR